MEIEGLPLTLLVNPASAHGRTLKLLPAIEQELDERRIPFRVERTRGLEDGVERALQAVEDPELPVSIVDLGMVCAVTVSAGAAVVELVPTFLACPALWLVESEVRERATGVPGVTQCQVIWRPGGWTGADVTEAGRAALGQGGRVRAGGRGRRRDPRAGERRGDRVPLARRNRDHRG